MGVALGGRPVRDARGDRRDVPAVQTADRRPLGRSDRRLHGSLPECQTLSRYSWTDFSFVATKAFHAATPNRIKAIPKHTRAAMVAP